MKSRQEILQVAKEKAAKLTPGTQIRVFGAECEKSYWVFNFQGNTYIGSLSSEYLPKFFPNKTSYEMINPKGKKIGELQQLILQ